MVLTFLSIAGFGVLGLSVLCPLLASFAYLFRSRNSRGTGSSQESEGSPPSSIDILLPAHNESEFIGATLTSLQRAVRHLETHVAAPDRPAVRIQVGANGCTDDTASIARLFPGVGVNELKDKESKWGTLMSLIGISSADWVILVDSGTVWPEDFLTSFLRHIIERPDAIGAAPSYQPLKSGWIHRGLWQFETLLKKIETLGGGPISLHGATLGYKLIPLKKALAYLGDTPWLNDDVVIPLTLRTLYPTHRILYPVGQVQDIAARQDRFDLGRRKRMLLGNLQWTLTLLPSCFRRNPVAGTVAARRLFRMLWAYWLAFAVIGVALQFHGVIWPAIAAAALLFALSGSFRQLTGAAWVSLQAPLHWARADRLLEGPWK